MATTVAAVPHASTTSSTSDPLQEVRGRDVLSSKHPGDVRLVDGLKETSWNLVVEGKRSRPAKKGPNPEARHPQNRSYSKTKTIIGKNINTGLVSWKGADLTVSRYIGRVANGTSTEEIAEFLKQSDVTVIELTRHETKYSFFQSYIISYKLVIRKSDLSKIEDENFWPQEVVVRRYFTRRAPQVPDEVVVVDSAPTVPKALHNGS
jgi:hypothetical protein